MPTMLLNLKSNYVDWWLLLIHNDYLNTEDGFYTWKSLDRILDPPLPFQQSGGSAMHNGALKVTTKMYMICLGIYCLEYEPVDLNLVMDQVN